MKQLQDGKIQVEAGDTLYKIYGSDWQKYYQGDPTKLQIGTILPAKQTSSPLPGTLPSNTQNTGNQTIPQTTTDNLSVFRNLLQQVSKRATQESKVAGVSAMGFEPSQVSGGTLSGIVDFINKQKTAGISDIYKSTIELMDNIQKQATDQLQTLISSGAIANLTDSALTKLASASGMDLDTLIAVRKQKQSDASKPTNFETVTKNGKKVRIGFNKNGNIISETTIGDASGSDLSESDRKRQAIKDMDTQIQSSGVIGPDGFISPKDWSTAKHAWTMQGYSADDFDTIFETYKNPENINYQ